TVYREHSEVSRLNRWAASGAVRVEDRLFDLLALAKRLTEQTDGAYDISAGALVKAWGFYRGPRRVPTEEERASARSQTGMRHVVLNAAERTVRYIRSGLEINLGSIGKGYALDRVAELLRQQWDLSTGLLHGGYSSVYAMGSGTGGRGWG